MAVQIKNRVRGTSTTIGTGTYTLGAAPVGFQGFDQITSGRQLYYCAVLGSAWEVGLGTLVVAGSTTLTRDKIFESSAGGAINWGAGTKDVFLVAPADVLNALVYDSAANAGAGGVNADLTGTLRALNAAVAQLGVNVAGSIAGVDTITGSVMPAITAYRTGAAYSFSPAGSHTGSVTFKLHALCPQSIAKWGAAA